MKLKPVKLAPALIVLGVITLVCLVRWLQPDFLERSELMTYDMRVRKALKFAPPVTTNLGFVFIGDDSITALNNSSLGFRCGLPPFPRHIYGRTYRELAAQGAKAVAFDVLFDEPRSDQDTVQVASTNVEASEFMAALHPGQPPPTYIEENEKITILESDDFFAWQLKRGGTAILAAEGNLLPLDLFATNALTKADITADRDADGVLRRVRAFSIYRNWHPVFHQAAREHYVDLKNVRIEPGRIVFLRPQDTNIVVDIDAESNFDLTDLVANLPPGVPRKAKAFTNERVWHMGIVLAAQELHLDLAKAEIDLARGRIVLRGANGVERIIPVDTDGYFFINWELTATDKRLTVEALHSLLAQDQIRTSLRPEPLTNRWAGRLVVVGSSATGNNLTDRGATPLEKDTFLVSKHWNVANSVITGRFVHRSSLVTELLLIVALGIAAGLITWQLRVLAASGTVVLLTMGYLALGVTLYVQGRYWLPLVLPVAGALLTHVGLVTWRVVFEQAERRRVRSVFTKVVSPNIVNELLQADKLSLRGARSEVTVLFADVRGFTEFTDKNQREAEAYVAAHKLSGKEAEAYYNEQARETFDTVNTYLALLADIVKKFDGTLDKYIGDCVMAFWGAPTPNQKHALGCVRAAIDAQQTFYKTNRQRAEHNKAIQLENLARASAGLSQKSLLPILLLGSGINTGLVTVGLMGSEGHIFNYTVFGREVNLASRLESVSGRGRIVISEPTYEHLRRDDPALAATCVALAAEKVKGISMAVKIYEVPWRPPGSISLDEEFFPQRAAEKSAETILLQREKI